MYTSGKKRLISIDIAYPSYDVLVKEHGLYLAPPKAEHCAQLLDRKIRRQGLHTQSVNPSHPPYLAIGGQEPGTELTRVSVAQLLV